MIEKCKELYREVLGKEHTDNGFYLKGSHHVGGLGIVIELRYAPNTFKDEHVSEVLFHKDGNIYQKGRKRKTIGTHQLKFN